MSSEEDPSVQGHVPGRLVFSTSVEADAAAVELLYDELFPPAPERRKSLFSRPASIEAVATESDTNKDPVSVPLQTSTQSPSHGTEETSCSAAESEATPGAAESTEDDAEFPPDIQRVIDRRQETLERFHRQQRAGLELRRRCGQPTSAGPRVWTPPVSLYRPPPLRALRRQLHEPGLLADTVWQSSEEAVRQIEEFSDRHGLVEEVTPRYRRDHTDHGQKNAA